MANNIEEIVLNAESNSENVILNVDDGNPYYYGARAYVTQSEDGAVIVIIDKYGTTTATVLNGADGNGITSITQNADYTLTISLDDGTSVTTDPVRGEKGETGDTGDTGDTGNGIASVELNSDYTLTINFTDGTSVTTDSIRGEKGDKGDKGDPALENIMDGSATGSVISSVADQTASIGQGAFALGSGSVASGNNSVAEGVNVTASGYASHAEGYSSTASGVMSHAEGYNTTASQNYTHAEGIGSEATFEASHAEGFGTTASGYTAHAEGTDTIASGEASHAEGSLSKALATYSHAGGRGTYANGTAQTVIGVWNEQRAYENILPENRAFVIGNGTDNDNRSDCFEVMWSGDVECGKVNGVEVEKILSALPTDTASGAIASFPDGTDLVPCKSLQVALEPIQDLNGYDKPWSGGNGANKLGLVTDIDKTVAGVQFTYDADTGTFAVNGTNTNTTNHQAQVWRAGSPSAVFPNFQVGETYTLFVDASLPMYMQFTYKDDSNVTRALGYCAFASGHATFTIPTNYASLNDFQMYINGSATTLNATFHIWLVEGNVSSSTFTPYSNICPISGRTECVTEVCGVNVWDEEWESGAYDTNTGAKTPYSGRIRNKNLIPILPSTTYYMKAPTNTAIYWKCYYDANGVFIRTVGSNSNSAFTTPQNAYYVAFYTEGGYGSPTYNNDVSINYPSTDHDYHAYNGDTYTTTLGRTVYGGQLDVVSGELVVDRAIVDLTSLSWVTRATGTVNKVYSASLPQQYFGHQATSKMKWICDSMPYEGVSNAAALIPTVDTASVGVYSFDAGSQATNYVYMVAPISFTAFGNLCYELAEPQTYQLTPTEVSLLLGNNNVWSDGDVTVVYNADIQRYIEKKLAE